MTEKKKKKKKKKMKKIVFINYFVKKMGIREECGTAFSNRQNSYTFRPPLTFTHLFFIHGGN